MSSDSESIAHRLHGELEALIRQVSQVEGTQPSIRETEEQLWTGMLTLGRGLMQLRLEACSTAEGRQDRIEVEGIPYDYQRQSSRAYVSLFGEVRLERAYYWNPEYGGVRPLDARLSMPARCYSDSGQERLSEMNVWIPQDHSLALFELEDSQRVVTEQPQRAGVVRRRLLRTACHSGGPGSGYDPSRHGGRQRHPDDPPGQSTARRATEQRPAENSQERSHGDRRLQCGPMCAG